MIKSSENTLRPSKDGRSRHNESSAFLIGPDQESAQWVSETARDLNARYATLKKIRRGDRSVTISMPDVADIGDRTPILLDDIISSGQTMLEAVKLLRSKGIEHSICLAIYGLFADRSDQALTELGAHGW